MGVGSFWGWRRVSRLKRALLGEGVGYEMCGERDRVTCAWQVRKQTVGAVLALVNHTET